MKLSITFERACIRIANALLATEQELRRQPDSNPHRVDERLQDIVRLEAPGKDVLLSLFEAVLDGDSPEEVLDRLGLTGPAPRVIEKCRKCKGGGDLTAGGGNVYSYECPRCTGTGLEPEKAPTGGERAHGFALVDGSIKRVHLGHATIDGRVDHEV